jgi:hypothetical protein
MSDYFDSSWIDTFEELEKDYQRFYKETVETINLFFVYVNKSNNVENVIQDKLMLENSTINKLTLLDIIRTNNVKNNIKYKLISMLKYNITLSPEEIKSFVFDELDETYLESISTIDDLHFDETITILNDLNCLYFIFYEIRETPRVIIPILKVNTTTNSPSSIPSENTPQSHTQHNHNTHTRKITFNLPPVKKTRRRI